MVTGGKGGEVHDFYFSFPPLEFIGPFHVLPGFQSDGGRKVKMDMIGTTTVAA